MPVPSLRALFFVVHLILNRCWFDVGRQEKRVDDDSEEIVARMLQHVASLNLPRDELRFAEIVRLWWERDVQVATQDKTMGQLCMC